LDPEAGALARLGAEGDATVVSLRDRTRDREPEAGSRNRVVGRRRRPEEALKEPLLLRFRDADPGVLDLDHADSVLLENARGDAAARRGELDGVREQVRDELSESFTVAAHRDLPVALQLQRHVVRACVRARGLDRFRDDVVEQDAVLDAELETTRVEPRDE